MDTQIGHMYQRTSNDQGPDRRQRPHNASNGNDNNPRKKETSLLKIILLIVALVSVLAVGLFFVNFQASSMNGQPIGEIPYSAFYQQVMDGNIKDATFQGQDITGDFKNAISERDDPFAGTALATGSRVYSEQTASIIDEEVNRIVKWAYDRAVTLLTSHRETLDSIARSLRLHETLDARQLRAIIKDTSVVHTGPL